MRLILLCLFSLLIISCTSTGVLPFGTDTYNLAIGGLTSSQNKKVAMKQGREYCEKEGKYFTLKDIYSTSTASFTSLGEITIIFSCISERPLDY